MISTHVQSTECKFSVFFAKHLFPHLLLLITSFRFFFISRQHLSFILLTRYYRSDKRNKVRLPNIQFDIKVIAAIRIERAYVNASRNVEIKYHVFCR